MYFYEILFSYQATLLAKIFVEKTVEIWVKFVQNQNSMQQKKVMEASNLIYC